MSKDDVLMIFLKPFVEGKVKTRLAKSIGNVAALEVYKALVKHTVSEAKKLSENINLVFCYSENSHENNLFSQTDDFIIQEGDTLGDRMAFAVDWAEKEGYGKKIIVGSDCAEISAQILQDAFSELDRKDVVLGPAKDGGYYLIGMNKPSMAIFQHIQWSTDAVYEETVQKIKDNNFSFSQMKMLSDIDDIEDLQIAALFLRNVINLK